MNLPKNWETLTNEKLKKLPHELAIEIIAERRRLKEPPGIPIPDDKLPEIARLIHERDAAKERMDEATNAREQEQLRPQFIQAHRALLVALGLKPCAADDCTNYVIGRSDKIYCSGRCKKKVKNTLWNKENPDKKARSNLKYWESIKKDLL